MEISVELWRRLFFLRTWVYFFAVMAYLFLGNLWLTIIVTEVVEALHSVLVYMRAYMEQKIGVKGEIRKFRYGLDVSISTVMAVVASLSIVFTEYVFNSVVFIGDDRAIFFIVFFVLILGARTILLFIHDSLLSLTTVFCVFFLLFFLVIIGTNEVFFNDARTVTISVIYIVFTLVTAVIWARWIHYYGYLVHAAVLAIVLGIFWHKHSPISLARYVNWKHSL